MTDPTLLTVAEASARLGAGEIDAVALTEAYLARIEGREPELNCYVTLTAEAALAQAEASAERFRQGRSLGPLDGIPIAFKDNIDVAGIVTTNGLGPMGNDPATADAEVVRRLRAAGAVFLGKLNMHEGAFGATTDNLHHGRTINPWRRGFTPGGSSGGSGAAVAARLSAAALGTDTMGSVRLPAAYCGVSGLKQTFGLVSSRGLHLLCGQLDHIGPLTRAVGDLGLMLDAMAGFDPEDPWSRPPPTDWRMDDPIATTLAGTRIGVLENFSLVELERDVAGSFRDALDRLRSLGAEIVDVNIPDYRPTEARRAGLLVIEADGAVIHESALASHPEAFSDEFRSMLAYGRDASAGRLARAQDTIHRLGFAFRRLFERVNLIASPTVSHTAFPFEQPAPVDQADLAAIANFAGTPAITVSNGLSLDELPMGLQLMAAPYAEAGLLGAAAAFEADRGRAPLPPEPGPPDEETIGR